MTLQLVACQNGILHKDGILSRLSQICNVSDKIFTVSHKS